MNNDAHEILVSALDNHGEKIATSDAYCKVYLAGYMVDYPDEKQLLISLRQLALPDALLAYRCAEISDSDIHAFIDEIDLKPSQSQSHFAWGVDAWAAALSMSDLMRRNIRKQCFPTLPQQLNTDSESVTDVAYEGPKQTRKVVTDHKALEGQDNQRNGLISLAAMILLGLTTIHFAVGSVPIEKKQLAATVPFNSPTVVLPNILPNEDKPTNTASISPVVADQFSHEELALIEELSQITVSAKPVKKPKVKAASAGEIAAKDLPIKLNTATKIQRTQRLNADIEAYLKQEH